MERSMVSEHHKCCQTASPTFDGLGGERQISTDPQEPGTSVVRVDEIHSNALAFTFPQTRVIFWK